MYAEADAEATVAASSGSGLLRGTLYTVLAAMLLGGAWVRFNEPLAALAPALAAPAAGVAEQVASAARIKSLVELKLLSGEAQAEALAGMGLPAADLAALHQALDRRELRLVQLPLFDAGAEQAAGLAGATIQVSAGGYTRLIRLTRQPQPVTLPIARVGTVSFTNAGAATASPAGIGIGALTLSGPVRLPDLTAGQVLSVGVVAQ